MLRRDADGRRHGVRQLRRGDHRSEQGDHGWRCCGNYTTVRTFTATDDAGNSSSATQTITVQDTTAPEFTFVPADYTVECSDEMMDGHGVGQLRRGDDRSVQRDDRRRCCGNCTIVRTFTATDDAGNSSSATQTITVQDTTAPEFTFVPADYTVECLTRDVDDDATAPGQLR